MGTVGEWKGFAAAARAVGDDVTFYECAMDFIATDGTAVHTEQVSGAKWSDRKIVQTWFFLLWHGRGDVRTRTQGPAA